MTLLTSARCCFALILFCFYADGHPISSDDTPFPFYTRKDWGAAPSTDYRPLKTPVPYVVIHHTYIPGACNTTAQCSKAMRDIQNYHQSLDFGDIGYHFLVGSEGGVYEGRGWTVVGTHATVANNYSIAICLIGDWRVELPPQKQLATAKALIALGIKQGSISPQYKLIGHSQVSATECPGGALLQEISTWDHYTPGHAVFPPMKNKSS